MKPKPLTPGAEITFRDHDGRVHPGVFIGRNPKFARVKMPGTEAEIVVGADGVEVRRVG